MSDASTYPITFGYGATDQDYYGPGAKGKATYIGPYHRGDDRAMPVGTPVVVNGVQIGLSGNGNGRYGAHLHIGKFNADKDVNPFGKGFQLDGAVVESVMSSYSDPVNGMYVRIRDNSGAVWVYLHMSRVDVAAGQVLKGEDMASPELVDLAWQVGFNARPEQKDIDYFKDKTVTELLQHVLKYNEDFRTKAAHFDEVQAALKQAQAGTAVNRGTVVNYINANLK